MRAQRLLRTASLVLGTGYVLFFFSERMFWAMWRPGDHIGIYVATWLLYALMAYLLLATIRCFRVHDFWGLFLAGAVFGWLCEGVYAMTMFGDASLPFPLTIAWTGLAWHAPISVVLGWYGLQRTLQAPSIWPGLGLSLLIGTFWGFWAVAWGNETPPIIAGASAFFAHAMLGTFALGASQLLIGWGDPVAFQPTRPGLIVGVGIVLAFYGLVTVPTVPWSPLLILPLFGLVFFALWRSRYRGEGPDALARLAAPVPLPNLVGLIGMPVAATVVYAGLNAAGLLLPSHQIVCAVTTLAGFVLFCVAIVKLSARGRGGSELLDPGRVRGDLL